MPQRDSVLVVDDNPTNCEVLQEMLEDTYQVFVTSAGENALQLAEQVQPRVVLLDVMLPGIDGYEVCRRLRQAASTCAARIIIVSAKAMAAERAQGLEAGADAYLTKPFDEAELTAAIGPT